MKDYYQILGVNRDATAYQIKSAYRRLVVQYHPDKNPDPAAHRHIREINEAYDVLGDEEKRQAYNNRTSYTWHEPLTPPAPRHRDPRYRQRDPAAYRPPPRPGQHELMAQYGPYVRTFCYAGLLLIILLLVDRALPFRQATDEVRDIFEITSGDVYRYDRVETVSGRKIVVYDHQARQFGRNERIVIQHTFIFRIPMRVTNPAATKTAYLGHLYRSLVFFPIILLITSLGGILTRKDVHFSFSLSLVSAILLILNLYLITRQ